MRQCSDRELLDRLARGDDAAARELITRYRPIVLAAATRHGLPLCDHDDLLQAVWEALLGACASIRVAAALPGWLHTTANRLCARVVDRRRRELGADTTTWAIADEHPTPEQLVVRAEVAALVRAQLARLPCRCRCVLELDETPPAYRQRAAAAGIAEHSVGPTRRRCLDWLRARLAEQLGEPFDTGDPAVTAAASPRRR